MTFVIYCPHCGIGIEVIKQKCCIFRCGILKSDYTQIPPHLPKIECDALVESDKIYGCGKPFKLVLMKPEICEYV